MAKSSSRGTQHSIHGGLSSSAAEGASDASRKISSKKSVNDEAVRTGVAVGDNGNKRKDAGKLK